MFVIHVIVNVCAYLKVEYNILFTTPKFLLLHGGKRGPHTAYLRQFQLPSKVVWRKKKLLFSPQVNRAIVTQWKSRNLNKGLKFYF